MEREALGRELYALLADLVAIPSTFPPGDTEGISAYCSDFLSQLGYKTEIHEKRKTVQSLVARLGSGKPSVEVNAHEDTVGIGGRGERRNDRIAATPGHGRGDRPSGEQRYGPSGTPLWGR